MAYRILFRVTSGLMASTIGTSVYLVSCDGNSPEYGKSKITLDEALRKTQELCQRIKEESGSPGLVAGVSVDGINVLNIGA